MSTKLRKTPKSVARQQKKPKVQSKSNNRLSTPGIASSKLKPASAQKTGSKIWVILTLLRRQTGASLEELAAATGWQAHSIRGCLSGTIKKKLDLKLISEKSADGVRRYRTES